MILARELNFRRAAELAHITQPTLSAQIQNLEENLGVALFVRGTRNVALTPAGHSYLADTRRIMSDFDLAQSRARRASAGEVGHLSIGFSGLTPLDTLPALIHSLRVYYPDVGLDLLEMTTREQMLKLSDGKLDAGIIRSPRPPVAVLSHTLAEDRHLVAIPATHPLAGSTTLQLGTLSDQNWVMPPRDQAPDIHDLIISTCAAAGFAPHIVQSAQLTTTLVALVAAGVGVAIVPPIARALQIENVRYLELSPPIRTRTWLIWTKQQLSINPALPNLINHLCQ